MLIKPIEKEIDGLKVTASQFPGMRGLVIKARLAKLLAPGVAELLAVFGGKMPDGKALEMDAAALAPAFSALASKLEPTEFANLCRDLLATTTIVMDGKVWQIQSDAEFDHVFTGRTETIYKVIFLVLQANDFFGLGGIGKALSRKAPEAKPPAENSPKT
jgi:hypothetical protein